MLDERSCTSSSAPLRATSAPAVTAETRDWVAEFRREQAHLIRPAPRQGPSRILSYGLGGTLAAALVSALVLALATLRPGILPAHRPVAAGPTAPVPATTELADAREEALRFDLGRARQEAEAARAAHLREVEALRAAAVRSEAGRERAEEARTTAEARTGALARDLDRARADLAAASRETVDARAEAAEERARADQLARHRAEADVLAQERGAAAEAALAQTARERDEARARLAETAPLAPAPAPVAATPPAPRPVDWALFSLRVPGESPRDSPRESARISGDEAPSPTVREPRRPEPDRKAGRRPRETAADRSEAAPRAGRGGRTKAGAERPPAVRPAPDLRLRGPASLDPDA